MTDTTPAMAARYEELLFSHSAEDRFEMGARMFDSARAMALASFPPNLSVDEVRRRLFARFYGHDIPAHLVPEALRPR